MNNEIKRTPVVKFSSPVRYRGNLFFLIFFAIVFLPIGVLLMIKNGWVVNAGSSYSLRYHGSWGWLYFWGIVCFPVAFLLLMLKGIDVIEEAN